MRQPECNVTDTRELDTNVCYHQRPQIKEMSLFSAARKAIHLSPSREHTCDSLGLILCQSGCLTYDHMLGTDLGLMEMTEPEYTHLQQVHLEAQAGPLDGPEARSHPASAMVKDAIGSSNPVISPFSTTQAIDLSTSTEEHCLVLPGEKTPASYGDVPGFVLSKIRGEDSPTFNSSMSSQKRSRSAARVCLEKRFNTMSADTPRPQDLQSTVLNNFLTMLQQTTEVPEDVIHPQMQTWAKTEIMNPFEVSNSYLGDVFNPVTSMCGQVIGHIPYIIEPNKHQGLIIPKTFSFKFHPERIATKAHGMNSLSPTKEQQSMNMESDMVTPAASRKHGRPHNSQHTEVAKVSTASTGQAVSSTRKRARSCMSVNQRKERHNSKERERRKRIRLYCDELNILVPFCDSDTDKVTTLQWTTAYLRYINKTYGDTFKEEFKKSVTDEKALYLKSSTSSGQDIQQMDEALSIPLAVEQ